MSGLLSNARRALLRPANPRDYTHTASRIIGATLPVTIASTYSATAQWYVIRYAVSHHNHQGCITLQPVPVLVTQRLDTVSWSALPHLHASPTSFTGTTLTTTVLFSPPLVRQSEPFLLLTRVQVIIIFALPLSHSAQGRPVFSSQNCGTIHLARVEGFVPPTSGFGDRRSPLSYTRICALPA